MAADEDRRALKQAAALVALHVRKVELKMRFWEELEGGLHAERDRLEVR